MQRKGGTRCLNGTRLARPKQYPLTDAERADLIQVVEGYTSPHDHDAARRGIEWMREHHRQLGQTVRF